MFTKTTSIASALVLAAASVSGQECSEAERFGGATFTPNTGLQPGSTVSVSANFACAFYFGIEPVYTTYQTAVTNIDIPAFLAYREPSGISASQPWDNFTITIPDANWEADTTYGITLNTYFLEDGPYGGTFLTEGSVGNGAITISSVTPA